MTKEELKKRIEELEELVNHQKRLIDMLYEQSEKPVTINYSPAVENETCPLGGAHAYVYHDTGGWRCKCGKSQPYTPFNPITV